MYDNNHGERGEHGEKKVELDWLKKNLVCSTNQKRQLVEPDNDSISVCSQCELISLPRASFYYEPAGESAENLFLMRLLDEQCLDWTERQPHLAGALGAAILNRLFEQKWIARVKGDRSVRIAPRGKEMFLQTFEIRL